MSLWDDDDVEEFDHEAQQERLAQAEDLWKEEPEVDDSRYSWHTLRRMKWEGLSTIIDGPGRQLKPYVTYLPSYISVNPDNPLEEAPPLNESLVDSIRRRTPTPRLRTPKKKEESAGAGGAMSGGGGDGGGDALFNAVTRARVRAEDVMKFQDSVEEKDAAAVTRAVPRRTRDDFTEDAAALAIQCAARRWRSVRDVRRRLVAVWRKKKDKTPGVSMYENVYTGELQWIPPRLFRRFFPQAHW